MSYNDTKAALIQQHCFLPESVQLTNLTCLMSAFMLYLVFVLIMPDIIYGLEYRYRIYIRYRNKIDSTSFSHQIIKSFVCSCQNVLDLFRDNFTGHEIVNL